MNGVEVSLIFLYNNREISKTESCEYSGSLSTVNVSITNPRPASYSENIVDGLNALNPISHLNRKAIS